MDPELAFRIAFWMLIGILLVIRQWAALRVRRAGERLGPDQEAIAREGRWLYAGRWAAFIYLAVVLVLYALNPPWMAVFRIPLPAWLRWAGFCLGLASLALLAWTQATLGKQWSAQLQLRAGHQLVTDGPYARVRHPMYTALCGFAAGLALVSAQWGFVLLAVVTAAGFVGRVGKE
jgi:protein-S-isoprenylcysteine O-methyltransferase Ste14